MPQFDATRPVRATLAGARQASAVERSGFGLVTSYGITLGARGQPHPRPASPCAAETSLAAPDHQDAQRRRPSARPSLRAGNRDRVHERRGRDPALARRPGVLPQPRVRHGRRPHLRRDPRPAGAPDLVPGAPERRGSSMCRRRGRSRSACHAISSAGMPANTRPSGPAALTHDVTAAVRCMSSTRG